MTRMPSTRKLTDHWCGKAGWGIIPVDVERALDAQLQEQGNAVAKTQALRTFSRQLDALDPWIARQLPDEIAKPPLQARVAALVQIWTQDLEPDPQGGGPRRRLQTECGTRGLFFEWR